jgi:hypothetical protein
MAFCVTHGPTSRFEDWNAATPAHEAGDYVRAYEIARAGLAEHPDKGSPDYKLASYAAEAGDLEQVLRHLQIAVERDPRPRGWARTDEDLDTPAVPA